MEAINHHLSTQYMYLLTSTCWFHGKMCSISNYSINSLIYIERKKPTPRGDLSDDICRNALFDNICRVFVLFVNYFPAGHNLKKQFIRSV